MSINVWCSGSITSTGNVCTGSLYEGSQDTVLCTGGGSSERPCDNFSISVDGVLFGPSELREAIDGSGSTVVIPDEIQLLSPEQTITNEDFATLSGGILTAFVIAWGIRVIIKRIAPKL